MKPRHTPIRTCVACRETDAKRDLLRVVRLPDGTLQHDPKGKLSGRGAYVCANERCIAQARKQKKFERALKVSAVPQTLFEELINRAAAQTEPEAAVVSPPTPPATPSAAATAATSPQKSEVSTV